MNASSKTLAPSPRRRRTSTAHEGDALPPSLRERFQDVELIGRGGMGVVYRAYDRRAGELVAIKLLRDVDSELTRRFLVEARAQARVEHARVCRIHEVGEADGEPYICMQLVPGEPLNRAAAGLTIEERVAVVRDIAEAVHAAHMKGVIHRDIKPSNVLVTREGSEAIDAYVVDFGLAREVSTPAALTSTGAILGTPMYMAPEQALGQPRSIGAHTDVWGLGATLFDVLAGRPPFVAEHPWQLLMMVASQEPPRIRVFRPDLPTSLETIVAKCLEHDPRRRYPSARALAEDLGRFLAGAPIAARPASLGYQIWKRARARKGAVLLVVVALTSALAISAAWLKGKREAEESARVAAELGEEVTSIEMFLRSARQMPLHDINQERALIRDKLTLMEARVERAGRAGEGPGQTALGRAYLELGDTDRALVHLERAEAAGYSSPALDYSLGLALSRAYERAWMQAGEGIEDDAERAAWVADINARLRDRGLAHLRAAVPSKIHAPEYVEGLLAFYEQRYDVALERARAAFVKAPWLYEAKRLEGDALHALAGEVWADRQRGWEARMEGHVSAAAAALSIAEEMGRSDVLVHQTSCSFWTRAMFAANYLNKPIRPNFERGRDACARAVTADSKDPLALTARALLHALFIYAIVRNPRGESPSSQELDEAVSMAEAAIAVDLGRAYPLESLGIALRARVIHAVTMGRDARPDLEWAKATFDAILRRFPRHVTAIDSLIQLEELAAKLDRRRGIDVAPRVERAGELLALAQRRRGLTASMHSRLARVLVAQAHQLVERGESPEAVRARVASMEPLGIAELSDTDAMLHIVCEAELVSAEHALRSGGDPRPLLDRVELAIERSQAASPDNPAGGRLAAWLSAVKAESSARAGRDPSADIEAARRRLVALAKTDASNQDDRLLRARIELLAGRLDDALAALSATDSADPRVHAALAEIHAARARGAVRGARREQDIQAGLAHAERAIELHGSFAPALLAKGRLLLEQARWSRDRAALRGALDSLDRAAAHNPLLAGAVAALAAEARALR